MITPPSGPVFVVGSMRSGSTMLRLMLDSHPRIAIPPETGFMGGAAAAKRIPEWRFGDGWYERLGWSEAEVDARLREFYGGMFQRYADALGKPRWGEKTPFHTVHMQQMARIFPDAGFVGIVRHPGAVAISMHRRFHYEFGEALAYWSDANKQMLASGLALGERFALCRYEDLVLQSEPVLRELLGFLGEPWAPEVVEHHRVQREKGAPRAAEGSTITSDPVDPSRAAAWLALVSQDERVQLRRVAATAEFLGYDISSPDVSAGWTDGLGNVPLVVTGGDLEQRRRAWSPEVDLVVQGRPQLMEIGPEELAVRLVRAEAALARVRSRRAVLVVDAVRRVQHGRSRRDVAAAWRTIRSAVRPGR